jgi:hypothetical protein
MAARTFYHSRSSQFSGVGGVEVTKTCSYKLMIMPLNAIFTDHSAVFSIKYIISEVSVQYLA